MNTALDECLEKMSDLTLNDYIEPICVDDSNHSSPLNTTRYGFCTSTDSDEVHSAPELDVMQRKIDNARLYPLEVKLYWTYEEVERGTSKKERKRRIDVPNSNKLKRKRLVNGRVPNPFRKKGTHKNELGYDADDEI